MRLLFQSNQEGSTIKRAIVHIGTHKTGTSTIQKTLFASRSKLLSDAGVLYPSISANQSIHLGTMFQDKVPNLLRMYKPEANDEESVVRLREKFRTSLEADLAEPSWHTVVISAESLWRFDSKAIARFIEWLSGFASDITVVAYVRHPVDWTRSVVQERLKGGRTLDQIHDDLPYPKWRQNFTRWLDVVGLERFRLVSFDDARDNEGVAASFCDVAGLPRETVLPFEPAKVANESMSLEAALLLDSFNRQQPLYIDGELSPERGQYAQRYGLGAMRSVPGNKFHLSAELAAKARTNSRPELEWLNTTFGRNLFPDVFQNVQDEVPSQSNTMRRETIDALAATLSSLLSEQARANNLEHRYKELEEQLEIEQQRNAQLQEQLEREREKNLWSRFFGR